MVESLLVFCEILSVKRIAAGSIVCTSLEFYQDTTLRSLASSYMKKERCTFCANFPTIGIKFIALIRRLDSSCFVGVPCEIQSSFYSSLIF